MSIRVRLSSLKETSWRDYVMRFAFGAIATVLAGQISKNFGPAVGGLFLAFPAIFPASATLIEKHERQRKEKRGLQGQARARGAVALESIGAVRGSCGMVGFGLMLWLFAENAPWFALAGALVSWIVISLATWSLRNQF